MIRYAFLTNNGLVHENNEDSLTFNESHFSEVNIEKSGLLFKNTVKVAVFDGVGGLDKGEVASKTCAKYLAEEIPNSINFERMILINIIQKVNNELFQKQLEYRKSGMLTTVVGAFIKDENIAFYNIGDSRVYLYKNENLEQVSVDDTFKNKLLKERKLDPSEIEKMDTAHVITNSLGGRNFEKQTTHTFFKTWNKKDIILLMSDGVSDLVNDEELSKILSSKIKLKFKAKEIEKLVLERGAHDNYSMILLEKI